MLIMLNIQLIIYQQNKHIPKIKKIVPFKKEKKVKKTINNLLLAVVCCT